MKRTITFLALAIGIFGCGQSSNNGSTNSEAGSAQTTENNLAGQPEHACADVAQFSAVGTICKSSSKVIFKRVASGWLDTASNLTWYDFRSAAGITRFQAETFCHSHSLFLPTGYSKDNNGMYNFPNISSDLITAEEHGIREVLKDLKGLNLWSSSSMSPVVDEEAYYFYFESGSIYHTSYTMAAINNYMSFSAQCVSPQSQTPLNNPESSKWGDILRDQGGGIIFTYSQKDAKQACVDQKMHLPTAREVAQLSASRGSKGILEIDEVERKFNNKIPVGYSLIKAKETDGKIDQFYFNSEGYKLPVYEMERGCLWTSSHNPDFPPPTWDYKVIFYQAVGSIDVNALYNRNDWVKCAIRCVH